MEESMRLKWEGRWDQLKGKAKQAWGDLTDDDLDVVEGDYDELVGKLEERTGETREAIEARLNA
ncbi:MAG TPA: CsbD family protein [Acidimicrobiia bacterium]|nr:CsbD family protein [Acidimicrobiia bacterium]